MNQSEPKSDLMAWLEQQWDKAVKDSETPDKELLEKYTFYDGLTTAYEFTIARLKNVPNPFLPSCLNYEDIDDSSQDVQPQVGDYGWAIRENAHGQDETPFHIERDEDTGPADGIAGHPAVREAGGRRGRRAVCEPAPAAPRRLHPEQDRTEDGRG